MILIWNLNQQLSSARETQQRQKKIGDCFMSTNCDVIVISLINGQFWAVQKSNSGRVVCNTDIFLNSNLLSYKNWKLN